MLTKIGVGYVCAQAPEPFSGAAGSILRASRRRTGPRRQPRQRRTAISVAAVLAGVAGILSQRHPPPNFPYPNTINNLKLPEQDGEIMHSMDETTTDAAFERETTDPSRCTTDEQQIMEQAVADIWEYWPFSRTARYLEASCHSTGEYRQAPRQGGGVKTPATIAKELKKLPSHKKQLKRRHA